MADYQQSAKIPVATLIEKESANGNRYFVGPYGNAKAIMFRDRRDAPDGAPVWTLYMQDSGREPWHPAGPDDGSARNPATGSPERGQGDHRGGPRPASDAAKRAAMQAQAPHARD